MGRAAGFRRRCGAIWVCLAVLLALLSACAASLKRPEITLVDIELSSLGRSGQALLCRFAVRNPNDAAFRLAALSLDLELDGAAFAKGGLTQAVVVPPLGEATVEVRLTGRLTQALALWAAARQKGMAGVPYRLVGRAEVTGYGEQAFERSGELLLPVPNRPGPQ